MGYEIIRLIDKPEIKERAAHKKIYDLLQDIKYQFLSLSYHYIHNPAKHQRFHYNAYLFLYIQHIHLEKVVGFLKRNVLLLSK